MAQTIKLKANNGKAVTVNENELLKAMYQYVNERFQNEHRQIILNANGENRFVIVPFHPAR